MKLFDFFLRTIGLRAIAKPPPKPMSYPPIDARSDKNLATLWAPARIRFEEFLIEAKTIAAGHGCDYIAIMGTRTVAEQDALYAQGRTKPGRIVTNARGGSSWHNYGLAMDCGVFRAGKYLDADEPSTAEKVHAACGAVAKKYGLEWGGLWTKLPDAPHYQYTAGMRLADVRARVQAGLPPLV